MIKSHISHEFKFLKDVVIYRNKDIYIYII
jgi:hypothetical protein